MKALDKTLERLESLISNENLSFDSGFDVMNKNYYTRRYYSGLINNITLSITKAVMKYRFPYWIGFHQANKLYIPIKKGEKGTPIMCRQIRKTYFSQETGMQIDKSEANEDSYIEEKVFWNTVYVFNIEQTSIDIDAVNKIDFEERPKDLEILLDKFCDTEKIGIYEDSNDCPYYDPKKDEIHLVPKANYYDVVAFYENWAHECAHSTGHKMRLDRNLEERSKDIAMKKLLLNSQLILSVLNLILNIV